MSIKPIDIFQVSIISLWPNTDATTLSSLKYKIQILLRDAYSHWNELIQIYYREKKEIIYVY